VVFDVIIIINRNNNCINYVSFSDDMICVQMSTKFDVSFVFVRGRHSTIIDRLEILRGAVVFIVCW